jgi:predicted DNA-binding transcriptional regulator AlpA
VTGTNRDKECTLAKAKEQPQLALGPNDVVRKKDGYRYFGLRSTGLDDAIKAGRIPKPTRLSPRCTVWLGSDILEWQRQKLESAK